MGSKCRTWMLGAGLLASCAAQAGNYLGVGAGAIPDNNQNGINVTFDTSGFQGPVGRVSLTLVITHTFVGDLRARLTSPNGTASLVLFSRTGYKRSSTTGASANLGGSYVFDDSADADWWSAAAAVSTSQIIPTGSYRTSTAGFSGISDIGGCSTHLNLAFGGLSPAQAGGLWTVNIADLASGDVGEVVVAVLTLDAAPVMFASGFEAGAPGPAPTASAATGSCKRAAFDYTGDGRSDATLVRNTGGGQNGTMTWSVLDSNGGASQSFVHGLSLDRFVDGDFDGDGIADAAGWRASTGTFLVRRSSRPGDALLEIPLGRQGDDPRHVGDYDGDGVADAAVYRMGGQPRFLIRLSSTGQLRELLVDGGTPSGGIDLNGDNRADVAVQTEGSGNLALYRQYDGVTGFNFLNVEFGEYLALFATGNHAGNARGDITQVQSIGGFWHWTTREAITGAIQPTVTLGAIADRPLTGDYDGDGLDDYAVWRSSSTPGQSRFIVRRSSNPATPVETPAGLNGDIPVAGARVN